jgi:hypothetical protein
MKLVKREAVLEGKRYAIDRYNNFDFDLNDFRLGMAAGVVFGALELGFRNVFPTWSWMGYAYKLSLNQSPATLFTILSKIGIEVYHQTDLFKGPATPDFAFFDIAISAIAIPVLLLTGNQNYLLGLTFIELGKQVALYKHPHYTF